MSKKNLENKKEGEKKVSPSLKDAMVKAWKCMTSTKVLKASIKVGFKVVVPVASAITVGILAYKNQKLKTVIKLQDKIIKTQGNQINEAWYQNGKLQQKMNKTN